MRSICDRWVRTFAAHWWAPQALPKVIPILSLRKQLNLFIIKWQDARCTFSTEHNDAELSHTNLTHSSMPTAAPTMRIIAHSVLPVPGSTKSRAANAPERNRDRE